MSMQEIGLKPKFYYPDGDEKGFQKQVPWTDEECILICLDNCRYIRSSNVRVNYIFCSSNMSGNYCTKTSN